MRVLVTGDRGHVGVPVAGFLRRCGYEVAGFDRADGADVLDLAAVRRAARGCTAIVHLAALAHDSAGSPEQIMAVNVLGTWHVLLAAEAAGVTRVEPFWEYGAFVDVRDVAAAVHQADRTGSAGGCLKRPGPRRRAGLKTTRRRQAG